MVIHCMYARTTAATASTVASVPNRIASVFEGWGQALMSFVDKFRMLIQMV